MIKTTLIKYIIYIDIWAAICTANEDIFLPVCNLCYKKFKQFLRGILKPKDDNGAKLK